jgi:hypothetical protein
LKSAQRITKVNKRVQKTSAALLAGANRGQTAKKETRVQGKIAPLSLSLDIPTPSRHESIFACPSNPYLRTPIITWWMRARCRHRSGAASGAACAAAISIYSQFLIDFVMRSGAGRLYHLPPPPCSASEREKREREPASLTQ